MSTSHLHKLTYAHLEKLKSKEKQKDSLVSDGGGLYIYVREYGGLEWVFRYTSPITKKRRKLSLGGYPDVGLKDARGIAAEKRAILSQNLDPLIEVDRNLREQIKEHEAHRQQQRNTVENIFSDWKKAELQNRKDQGEEIERAFEKDVFPIIGSKPIGDITRQDIKDILARPLARKSKRMANRLLSDLRQFFGYIQDEELISQDPTRRMFKSRVGGVEQPRKRYLSVEERRGLATLLPESGLSETYQHAIWLLLSTGCRVDELSKARWSHIDFDARALTIPSEHAKNKDEHKIYLSDFTLTHLNYLRNHKMSAVWLFPDRKNEGPIHRQTLSKQIADRQRSSKIGGRSRDNDK
ncbi:MAG TPA: integrase arm-type DNA-binding domain-containing protein, partial [Alphaproteobacteria bacterium]|nr:integrase arm-type DNA-binding domain-containing protein [Alphaproteobacteria bacterium]